ncbi:DUF6379 domain-containing protein [Chitinophagaceae bacterium LB-8]|uniref:C-deglycosylation enzyme beta subunit n=1 Tax=Paraflavisolibacter caeni TaxID=2982496 RepID=A0A9X2XW53_9BACT|nr:DUF6379 domain-containing protein [Paraflavisolibacter caeni]MCU7549751.1 DUF6379 domain-containing protein [Paraflavisolibacter caeni]
MGPLDNFILADDALQATPTGFTLQFHSHWYRSLPLSCMSCKAIINGQAIDESEVFIEANGNKYPFSEMPNLYKEWLFITDGARLHVNGVEPLQKGKQYNIEFKLDLFIPYILVGREGNPLLASSTVTKQLTCN